jgi:BirA family biotin operon repressor/biotin-[acetyl-CoA-carboxylase] ligase
MATPYVTITFDEVESTQDLAVTELSGSDQPVLIVAKRQSAGRGRSGNLWFQAPRGVAASLGFRADMMQVTEAFPLAVGLAVRRSLHETTGAAVALKWPNDLESAGRKVGGILVERSRDYVIAGCGINLWWPDPPPEIGAVFPADPGDAIGREVSQRWAELLLAGRGQWDREEYRRACTTLGSTITWEPDGAGEAVAIDDDGGLVVRTASTTVTLRSGAVRTVRAR